MKKFKRILAIVLSIAMVLGMNTMSFAASESGDDALADVVLNGGEEGGSKMIGKYTAPSKKGVATDDYKYLGYASFLDQVPDKTYAEGNYKYLVMTYTGDITQLRYQFNRLSEDGDQELTETYWFNPEGQEYYFVTPDGSEIPLIGDDTTVVLDLEKSGVELDWYNSGIHMHCDEMLTHGDGKGFTISNAYLTTKLPATEEPSTEESSEEASSEEESSAEESTEESSASVDLPDEIILNGDDTGASSMIGTLKGGSGYNYAGFATLKGATDAYKYLKLTYTGDVTELRFQFSHISADGEETDTPVWFASYQDNHFVTADGSAISLTGDNTTIYIDLAKSGVDLSWYNSGVHMHTADLATRGDIVISDARLLKSIPEESSTEESSEESTEESTEESSAPVDLPDELVLNGDDTGASSMIGTLKGGAGYNYAGFATLKGATDVYKYMKITYTGDVTELRFQFTHIDADGEETDTPVWFASYQDNHFVSADGTEIPLVGDNTTVVIDLVKSGIDLSWYNSGVHMHTADLATRGDIVISDARLLKTYTPATPVAKEITVEAENYINTAAAVKTMTVGDSTVVYAIQRADKLEYTIDVAKEGYYRFDVWASRKYDGTGAIKLYNGEDILAKADTTTTGGWQVFEKFEGTYAYLPAGKVTVSIVTDGASNLDKFELIPVDEPVYGSTTVHVEAEDYVSAPATTGLFAANDNDTLVVYSVHDGDTFTYSFSSDADFSAPVSLRAAKKYGSPVSVDFTIEGSDGSTVNTSVFVSATSGWSTFESFSSIDLVSVKAGVTYTVTVKVNGDGCNMNYFELSEIK